MERTILHCDCNSFFASVETVAHPEYAKVPMAVCGSVEDRHGIVLAKNELAKKAGVITGETVWMARRKCPDILVVHPTHGLYSQYSKAINAIYYEYTDRIEPFGCDESWLDVTGSFRLFGDGRKIADTLRERIKKEMGITISVGVSFTKTFAKLGSDYKKPDATTVISRENYKNIIYPLPAESLLFVGAHGAEKLHMLGIDTIGQIACANPEFLESSFGKTGISIYNAANGIYDGEVAVYGSGREEKSVGNGHTFKRDITSFDEARSAISVICDEVAGRMRKYGVKGRTITLSVRDNDFSVSSKRVTLEYHTCVSKSIAKEAYSLFKANWSLKKPIRSITVSMSGLIRDGGCEQLKLFYSEDELKEMKLEKLERTVDTIRSRFGYSSLVRAVQV